MLIAIFMLVCAAAIAAVTTRRLLRHRIKALPVQIDRECGQRSESGLPIDLWLAFQNDSADSHAIKLTIEYHGGRDMVLHLTVAPGCYRHKIPEPHRVQRIRVGAEGYNGVVIYI